MSGAFWVLKTMDRGQFYKIDLVVKSFKIKFKESKSLFFVNVVEHADRELPEFNNIHPQDTC